MFFLYVLVFLALRNQLGNACKFYGIIFLYQVIVLVSMHYYFPEKYFVSSVKYGLFLQFQYQIHIYLK